MLAVGDVTSASILVLGVLQFSVTLDSEDDRLCNLWHGVWQEVAQGEEK